jgi:hypothetical protein
VGRGGRVRGDLAPVAWAQEAWGPVTAPVPEVPEIKVRARVPGVREIKAQVRAQVPGQVRAQAPGQVPGVREMERVTEPAAGVQATGKAAKERGRVGQAVPVGRGVPTRRERLLRA